MSAGNSLELSKENQLKILQSAVCIKTVQEIRNLGVKARSGIWTDNEINLLKSNWETYFIQNPEENRDLYRVSLPRMHHGRSNIFKKVMSNNILRPWHTIKRKIDKLFCNCENISNGPLTDPQKKFINENYFNDCMTIKEIAIHLRLSYSQVNKYVLMKMAKVKISSGSWSEYEDNELIKAILVVTGKKTVEELFDQRIKMYEVSKLMRTRNYMQCFNRFYKVLQPRIRKDNHIMRNLKNRDIWDPLDNIALVSALKKYECKQEIEWDAVQIAIQNEKSINYIKNRFQMIRKRIPGNMYLSLQSIIAYAEANFYSKWKKNTKSNMRSQGLKSIFLPNILPNLSSITSLSDDEITTDADDISVSSVNNDVVLDDSDETSSSSDEGND